MSQIRKNIAIYDAVYQVLRAASQPLTYQDLLRAPEVKRVGVLRESVVMDVLQSFRKKGVVARIPASGCGVGVRYMYELAAKTPTVKPPPVAVKERAEDAEALTDVKVLMVKETGMLRVEFKGLRVEIGVA